ncbi:MAG TPA: hypothetical protein VFD63_04020 [Pyrinomonadaceae bacterium]|nr:hypothetical protein [Pyrinomonadaceae bacterium]
MLYPKLELELATSKKALQRANKENIVDQCKHYLALLGEYRVQLYDLQSVPGVRQSKNSSTTLDEAPDRKAIREAIETTTRERNTTQVLLLSFTTVSGYEAVEIFNERKYQGHDDWELRASGVKFHGADAGDLMTTQEAVQLASLLRREDYVTGNAISDES